MNRNGEGKASLDRPIGEDGIVFSRDRTEKDGETADAGLAETGACGKDRRKIV